MLNDSHIHVGQFREIYTSPRELVDFLDSVGVQGFAVSSTTIWEENYEKVLSELRVLLAIAQNRVHPILWITPFMLDNAGLECFLRSEIHWYCVKVHGVHPWTNDGLQRCVDIARELHVPLLFHTGGFEQCEAGAYLPIIKRNADVRFILAHARPIEQALRVMHECPNAWADTAFTPIEAIKQLIDAGFADRTLWGTDYPIPRIYYKDADCPRMYKEKLLKLRDICSLEQWESIICNNFNNFF